MGIQAYDFKKDALMILDALPDLYLILSIDLTIIGVSDAYLNAALTTRQKIVGKCIFEVFTNKADDPNATGIHQLHNSLNRVLINKVQDTMPIQKYNIRQQITEGLSGTRYWGLQNSPVLDKKNKVKYIIHRMVDVTSFMTEKSLPGTHHPEIIQYFKYLDEINQQLRIAEDIHLAILDAIPDAMLTIDREGVITDINQALLTLFGYSQHELLGQQMEMLIPEPYRSRHPAHREMYFKSPRSRPMGLNMVLFGQQKNGNLISIEISLSPLTTTQGQFAIAIIRDVSLRIEQTKILQEKEIALTNANIKLKREKEHMEVSHKKSLLLTGLSETLVSCKNQDELVIVISSYASKILDFSNGVLYLFDSSHKYLEATTTWGQPNKYAQIIPPEDCWAIRRGVMHELNAHQAGIACDHIDSPQQQFSYICIPVIAQNEIFGLIYVEVKVDIDIESYRKLQLIEQNFLINMVCKTIALAIANIRLRTLLRDQSIRDVLTGLYNRRFLDEYLIKQIFYAKRQNNTIGIIMLDIDDFKKINDMHGHEVGDLVLEKLGHLLTRISRAEDVVCRYGGEEFVCILQNCSLIVTQKRAEQLRRKIQQMTKGSFPPKVTISLGISMYPDNGSTPNELIETADKALYESKNTGKNKVTTYSDMIV